MVDKYVKQLVEALYFLLLSALHRLVNRGARSGMDSDQEVFAEEDVEIQKFGSLAGMKGFQNRENVVIVIFGLGSLDVAAVFDLKFVQLILLRQLIQRGRSGIVQVIPGYARQRLGYAGHGPSVYAGLENCEIQRVTLCSF